MFFEPFRPRLSSKFAKSANMIKNAELDADFESFEKVAKNLMKKVSTKSDRKIEFLTFIIECKSFRPITYGVNFQLSNFYNKNLVYLK